MAGCCALLQRLHRNRATLRSAALCLLAPTSGAAFGFDCREAGPRATLPTQGPPLVPGDINMLLSGVGH